MKILITGSSGFIESELVKEISNKHEIILYDLKEGKDILNYEQLKASIRDCDIAYSTSKVIGEQILANYGLTKKIEVIILRLGPTRDRGEYKPFGELKLHLKIENALQALELSINSEKKIWYEYFTITDELEHVDITKAKNILSYNPR